MPSPPPEFDLSRALRRLRMRHIELLSLLGNMGTVRAAARQMSLTQPAVSKMLREIETSFAVPLFERSRSGVVPTLAGRHLIAFATAAQNDLAAAGADVARIAGGEGACLRLGSFSVFPRIPKAITELRRLMPGVAVQVREGTGVLLLNELSAGKLDCIVGALPPELLQTADVSEFSLETIAPDEACIMASPAHPLSRARSLRWPQLKDAAWALPPRESLLRRSVIDMHLLAGMPVPSPAVELLSPVSLAELLAEDPTLIGVMRYEHALAEHRSGRLHRLPLRPRAPLPPIALITLRRSSPRQDLLDALRATLMHADGQRTVRARRGSKQ